MSDDEAMRLLEKAIDGVADEVDELQESVKDVGALRREVEMLKETVRSNTQVMYVLVGLIISSGLAGALLKGLI